MEHLTSAGLFKEVVRDSEVGFFCTFFSYHFYNDCTFCTPSTKSKVHIAKQEVKYSCVLNMKHMT